MRLLYEFQIPRFGKDAHAMMRQLISCSLALLIVIQLQGCDPSGIFGNDDDDEFDPIQGRILFSVSERYPCGSGECEPSIFLVMKTEATYGCCNYKIVSYVISADDKVTINLMGIYEPEICLTAIGPATSSTPLDLNPGTYRLQFRYKDRIDEYKLVVTNESLAVGEIWTSFTDPMTLLAWRYPHRTFAYVCGTMTDNAWICDDFLDLLLSTDRFVEFSFPDYGSIPYPAASSGHYNDTPARYFRYETEADCDTAGAILGRYSREVLADQSGVTLYILNWRQKWYQSWMLDD